MDSALAAGLFNKVKKQVMEKSKEEIAAQYNLNEDEDFFDSVYYNHIKKVRKERSDGRGVEEPNQGGKSRNIITSLDRSLKGGTVGAYDEQTKLKSSPSMGIAQGKNLTVNLYLQQKKVYRSNALLTGTAGLQSHGNVSIDTSNTNL